MQAQVQVQEQVQMVGVGPVSHAHSSTPFIASDAKCVEVCYLLASRTMFPLEDAIGSHVCLGSPQPFLLRAHNLLIPPTRDIEAA